VKIAATFRPTVLIASFIVETQGGNVVFSTTTVIAKATQGTAQNEPVPMPGRIASTG
jgi:hypothetical protein